MNIYEWADFSINSSPLYSTGFTQLLAEKPYLIDIKERNLYDERYLLIQSFQNKAIDIFKASIKGEISPEILHWLLNETPISIGLEYHRGLEERHYSLPVFFRTDEAKIGRIMEIQCPGSLWGELELTYNYLKTKDIKVDSFSPAAKFASQLSEFIGETPIIHHLLDNSSVQPGMRYFIEKTRPMLKYYTIDYGIKANMCNFIRSHSFFGLCSENEFCNRLFDVHVKYDLPPNILFDQKATLVLPFWSLTRKYFSDEIRKIFLFTVPLMPDGIELPDGSKVTIDEFSQRSRSQRAYYLKYAGSDISINWGSKGVYRLSNMSSEDCIYTLKKCISQYSKGHIWLLQQEETHDDEISYYDRDNNVQRKILRAKFCAFYGPKGYIGGIAMHRKHNKVHGQDNTIISNMLAEGIEIIL